MDARGRLSNLGASDGRCERLCDVLQFCSPTSLQSRFAACFNKNNLSGTFESLQKASTHSDIAMDLQGNIPFPFYKKKLGIKKRKVNIALSFSSMILIFSVLGLCATLKQVEQHSL